MKPLVYHTGPYGAGCFHFLWNVNKTIEIERTEPNLSVSLKCELDRRRHNYMQL